MSRVDSVLQLFCFRKGVAIEFTDNLSTFILHIQYFGVWRPNIVEFSAHSLVHIHTCFRWQNVCKHINSFIKTVSFIGFKIEKSSYLSRAVHLRRHFCWAHNAKPIDERQINIQRNFVWKVKSSSRTVCARSPKPLAVWHQIFFMCLLAFVVPMRSHCTINKN